MTSTVETWTSWLCDLEPEDYNFINQSNTNEVEGSFPSHRDVVVAPLQQEHNLQQGSFSAGSHNSSSTMSNSSGDVSSYIERPSKTLKTGPSNYSANNTGYLPQKKDSHSSLSYILSFNNESSEPILNFDSTLKPKGKVVNNHGRSLPSKGSLKKEPKSSTQESKKTDSVARSHHHHAQDHIIAERKRREKISQQFIALSALIPDLKKMDKASVLGDAIKHVKQLQEQVKLLEEQAKRKSIESVVYVEKSKSSAAEEDVSDDTSSNSGKGNSSCDPSKTTNLSSQMPEVEARVSEKNVLIRIHCENQKGVLMNIIKEIENLHLSVTNSSTLLFGTSKLDITIIAEMDEEFSLSVKELARNLQVGLFQFM